MAYPAHLSSKSADGSPIQVPDLKTLQAECVDLWKSMLLAKGAKDRPYVVLAKYQFANRRLLKTFTAWHKQAMDKAMPNYHLIVSMDDKMTGDFIMVPTKEMAEELAALLSQ